MSEEKSRACLRFSLELTMPEKADHPGCEELINAVMGLLRPAFPAVAAIEREKMCSDAGTVTEHFAACLLAEVDNG